MASTHVRSYEPTTIVIPAPAASPAMPRNTPVLHVASSLTTQLPTLHNLLMSMSHHRHQPRCGGGFLQVPEVTPPSTPSAMMSHLSQFHIKMLMPHKHNSYLVGQISWKLKMRQLHNKENILCGLAQWTTSINP